MLRKAEMQAEGIRRRLLSGLNLEIRKQNLQEREDMIAGLFQRLVEKYKAFRRTEDYANVLKHWIREGIEALQEPDLHLVTGDVERKWLTREFLQQIEKETASESGRSVSLNLSGENISEEGVIIESGDGRLRFDNRITSRIQRNRKTMRLFVYEQLFKHNNSP